MEMRLCANNHYYDQSVHAECPYCNPNNASLADIGVTIPATPSGDVGKTEPVGFGDSIGHTTPAGSAADDGATQVIIKTAIGLDPVVGWLVCLEGKDKGRDYRIHADNNFIGRAENMDIVIRNDDTISRVNHAVISYDTRTRAYYFAQGSGRGIVRVNDMPALATVVLTPYDRIEIGSTKLMFVPLCGEEFNWTAE
ncbi:MAG: FHA domain-containing protein [Oscillospiraceae bacterium]|jgi:hypothetical protein|nr:FHA domain-containing protein [Oscillospiraceae bacterium]